MKATLTFDLPEEHAEHVAALRGGEALGVLAEIDRHCRSTIKHGDPSNEARAALQAVRELIPADLLGNAFLGTADWYDEFYKVETKPTLFGDHQVQVKASMDVMARYFNSRLKQVFAGVAEEPGVLWNSSKNPLYMFCFAVGNERGKDIALRIANHLLKTIIKEVR